MNFGGNRIGNEGLRLVRDVVTRVTSFYDDEDVFFLTEEEDEEREEEEDE